MARKHGNKNYVTIVKKVGEGDQYGEVQGECLPSAVAVWERNGWTVVDDGSNRDASEEQTDSATPEPEAPVVDEGQEKANAEFVYEAQKQLDNKDKE